MSQRPSGYERKERDLYETPAWVTDALVPHLPNCIELILEPACGGGKMVKALENHGYFVLGSDIEAGADFLNVNKESHPRPDAVITNPPYALAQAFIETALDMPEKPIVAMLLRTDFDHAKTRQHLFSEHRAFAKKLVLTKRIVWFDGPKAAPSFNHAWYIWDWQHSGPPTLTYGPALTEVQRSDPQTMPLTAGKCDPS